MISSCRSENFLAGPRFFVAGQKILRQHHENLAPTVLGQKGNQRETFSFPFYVLCTPKRFKILWRELNKVLRVKKQERKGESVVNLS